MDASHSHMEAESSGVTAHSNKVLAGRLDARIGSLEATGLDIEGSEHNIEIGRAEFRAISDIARNEVANSRIEGTIGLACSIASSEGLSAGVSESEVISRRYNHIKSKNLNITGSRVSGAVQIDSEVVRIDLDELSLRTVQGESLSSNSGFGIAVDHKASAISDFVRSADVHVGSSESRVTREMGGIAASSGVIEVRDLELIGSVIIKKPASLEELGVEAPSRREESVEDSVESRGFGAGFSSPAAGSSFGAEVRVSASGVDMSRVVGAGAVLGGSFEVGSEGFVGSSYDLDVSWADVVDRAALEEAWSGGVSDISGRVAESVAVASRDVVDSGRRLVQIGSSVLELPADIVDALIGTKRREDGVEESKGVEAEDAVLAAGVAAGDELSEDEEDDEGYGYEEDPELLGDEELRSKFSDITDSILYVIAGPRSDEERVIISEYERRFPEELARRQEETAAAMVPSFVGKAIEWLTGKDLGVKLDLISVPERLNLLERAEVAMKASKREVSKLVTKQEAGLAAGIEVEAGHSEAGIKATHQSGLQASEISTKKDYGFKSEFGIFFEEPVEWSAPVGTKQTYKIYQRTDINWDQVRTDGPQSFIGMTNREAARAGKAPQLPDGHFATLHHLGQDSRGGLVEASTRYHGVGKPGQNILHGQFGRSKPNPDYPIDRAKFSQETALYWKNRILDE